MKWSDWYRKKDNDEIDKWIKMWFTGTHSFSAIIISMLSIFCLYLKYIDISINILFNSISVIMFVIIQLIVNLRKRKNLNLQIKRIENANYEREFIFFEEETTKDIYFTEWDLGNKLKIGQTFKIDKLEGNQYHKEKIIIDNKEQEAYYLKKIDKEKLFNINK